MFGVLAANLNFMSKFGWVEPRVTLDDLSGDSGGD